MKHGYIVVVQDQESNGFGQIGYIGNIELDHKLYPKSMVAIGEDLYFIKEIRAEKISTIYVHKMQKAELQSSEYESDIRKQTLAAIFTFLEKHRVKTFYYAGGVRLAYAYADSINDFQAFGDNLTDSILNLRNEMIRQGIIKRGEW